MKAVVTGVAGFIGSHLAETLVRDGTDVTGIDRLSDYYDPEIKRRNLTFLTNAERFRFVEADINDAPLEQLLDGADVVYHLAGQAGVRSSWGSEFDTYVRDNVLSTQHLLEVAREVRPGRFVYASSSSIYGNAEHFPTAETELPRPLSPYGVTKLAGEHLCRLYATGFEVPTVSVRYFTIFGPRQRPDMAFNKFISAALENREIQVLGDGLQERDFTYVADAVAATVAAAEQGEVGGIYNVAGGNHATVLDVIQVLGELLGKRPRVEMLPAIPGDARKTGGDTSRARERLGYVPRIGLAEGLARQLAAEKEQPDTSMTA